MPIATTTAAVLIAQQVASKASRDGFFLEQISADWLPVMIVGSSIFSFTAALLVGRALSTYSPAIVTPAISTLSGSLFLIEATVVDRFPQAVAVVLFFHTAGLSVAVVSGFWSVVNERFDPYAARAVVGRIVVGATFGGALGGVLAWLASDLGFRWLLVGFGAASFLVAASVAFVAKGGDSERPPKKPQSFFSGAEAVVGSSYLRVISVVVFVFAATTSLIDYVFKAAAADSSESLIGFFAVFYTGTGILTFLAQALGSKRVLEGLGVVPSVAILPAATAILGGVALLYPNVWILTALRGGAMVIENSFFRSGYELLFTAVPKPQKRGAKILIDLASDKMGAALGGGIAALALALLPSFSSTILLLLAVASALIALPVLIRVQAEYVGSLASNLRGALGARNETTTPSQLARTFVGEAGGFGSGQWALDNDTSSTETRSTEELVAAAIKRAEEKMRSAGSSPAIHLGQTGVSEELLDSPLRRRIREHETADEALARSAPAFLGALGDIALSAREPLEVRIRAVELLSQVPSERSGAALKELLEAQHLRLRRAAAVALLRVYRAIPALRPDDSFLTRIAAKELRRADSPTGERTDFEASSPFHFDAKGRELSPTLENVFLFLALGGELDGLELAVSAVTSGEESTRGTGLEYLDNKIPGDLRSNLLALVQHPARTHTGGAAPSEVALELVDQFRKKKIDLRELRRHYRDVLNRGTLPDPGRRKSRN
ncbi:MAG: MFS transporter [Myxococcota bacterium]